MSANLSLIGSRVREFRPKVHFTQENLAEHANLTVQHCEFAELIIDRGIDERDAILDATIAMAEALRNRG